MATKYDVDARLAQLRLLTEDSRLGFQKACGGVQLVVFEHPRGENGGGIKRTLTGFISNRDMHAFIGALLMGFAAGRRFARFDCLDRHGDQSGSAVFGNDDRYGW